MPAICLKEHNWFAIRKMWRAGKDTHFIAEHFGVPEAKIYNGLAKGRGEININSPSPRTNITTHHQEPTMKDGALWTPDEDAVLRDGYARGLSSRIIGQAIGRKREACNARAQKLRLVHPKSQKRGFKPTAIWAGDLVRGSALPTLAYVPLIEIEGRYKMEQAPHVE